MTDQHSERGPVRPREELGPALADAARIAARAVADEAAADEAAATKFRARRREASPAPLDPDQTVGSELGSQEVVFAVRLNTLLEWHPSSEHAHGPVGGSLYLTSSRLLHLGMQRTAVELRVIEETQLMGERLLILLKGGDSFALDVHQPRLLRAQVAAVLAARRGASMRNGETSGAQIPPR